MQPNDPAGNNLKKVLGIAFGIAVLVGGTIGSGILRNPGTIADLLGSPELIIACWVFGGLYVLMGVNAFAELATMFPQAGGSYNYVREAYGSYGGFLTGWYDFISNGIGPSYFCILIGEYLVLLFPSLQGYDKILAIIFLIAFTLLHLMGVKAGSIAQQVTSAIKILFFAALIIACFVAESPASATQNTPVKFSAAMLVPFFAALQLVIGTYSGWNASCFFAEEDKRPGKNIPRSLFIGSAIVIAIYLLVNLAFMKVLPVSSLANSQLAASDVAQALFGNSGAILITVIAVFSIISILNAYMMIPARILFGMSRDRFFVRKGSEVNQKGTPAYSLLFASAVNLILILVGSFNTLFSLAAFMSIGVYILVYASLLKLRNQRGDQQRPYKAWGFPYSIYLALLVSFSLFLGFAFSDPVNLGVITVVTLLSYPAFRIIYRKPG